MIAVSGIASEVTLYCSSIPIILRCLESCAEYPSAPAINIFLALSEVAFDVPYIRAKVALKIQPLSVYKKEPSSTLRP